MAIPELPAVGDLVRVIAVRGIPGSGKSTWAKSVQDAYPPGTVARINNDDLTHMLFGATNSNHTPGIGKTLQSMRAKLLDALLLNPQVRMVIVDNTNLNPAPLRSLEHVAASRGGILEVDDRFLSVPLETCLERNSARENPVPESVIRKMHKQASSLGAWHSLATPVMPYHNDPQLPHSVLVDVDGTLAHMHPERSPYDWSQVGMDSPNMAVVHTVRALREQGVEVIIMSGRDGSCRAETQAWLDTHVAPGLPLHMREAGDSRPDHVVKLELFNKHIADRYHVRCVFDDRDQVVTLWRRQLGLPTFQVADGDF